MSTLTKIFIVLMVVFSIAFTMSMINFVARTNEWRDLAEKYRAQAQIVETHMRNLSAAHVAEKAAWLDTVTELRDQIDRIEAARADDLVRLAELRDEVARLSAEKTDSEALARRLASELQVAQNGWLEQRQQRQELERRNLELERRNLDLNERVNEQTAQLLVLIEQQNQLEQQINILRQESRKLAGLGPGLTEAGTMADVTGVAAVAPPGSTPIRGKIIEVQGDIATISVGSADGVRAGAVFVIYRGSEYIGDFQVTDVEPNLSAGKIIRSQMAPRPKDMVADEPALGRAR